MIYIELVQLSGEGSTRCMPPTITTKAGKHYKIGGLKTAGVSRNKRPQICMLNGLPFISSLAEILLTSLV